jgi:hypothetical protein
MRLFTIQCPTFDIVNDDLDLSKSPHYNGNIMSDEFGKAYDWLFQKLGTEKIIWCHSYADFSSHGQEFKRWELEVPLNEILAILETNTWNCIINDWYPYPVDMWNKWFDESKKLPLDKQDKYITDKENEYAAIHDKEEQKDNVFVDKIVDGYHEYLLPSPIKPEWVVGVVHASGWSEEGCIWHFDDVKSHTKEFDNCDKAFEYLEMCNSFLKSIKKTFNSCVVYKKDKYYALINDIS